MDTSNLLTEAEQQVKKENKNSSYLFLFTFLGEGSDTEQGGVGEVHKGAGDPQGCVHSKDRRSCRRGLISKKQSLLLLFLNPRLLPSRMKMVHYALRLRCWRKKVLKR